MPILIVHTIFLVIWAINEWLFEDMGTIALFEMLVAAFAVPCYLIVINTKEINKKRRKILWLYILFLYACVCSLVSVYFHYFNWGIISGDLLNPDSETVYIRELIIEVNLLALAAWLIVMQVYYLFTYLKLNKRSKIN